MMLVNIFPNKNIQSGIMMTILHKVLIGKLINKLAIFFSTIQHKLFSRISCTWLVYMLHIHCYKEQPKYMQVIGYMNLTYQSWNFWDQILIF